MFETLEKIPIFLWYSLEILTTNGKGITFYDRNNWWGCGANHGSKDYLNMSTDNIVVIIHEMGHCIEQYCRITLNEIDFLNPIWRRAIRNDNISVSSYGRANEWEDYAEFVTIYAIRFFEIIITT